MCPGLAAGQRAGPQPGTPGAAPCWADNTVSSPVELLAKQNWLPVRSRLDLGNARGVSWARGDLGHGPPCPTQQGAALLPGPRAEGLREPPVRQAQARRGVPWGAGVLVRLGRHVEGSVEGGAARAGHSGPARRSVGAEPGTRSAPRQPQKGPGKEVGGEWPTLGPTQSPAAMDGWVWGREAGAEAGARPAGQPPIGGHGTSCYLPASVGRAQGRVPACVCSGAGAGQGDPSVCWGDLGMVRGGRPPGAEAVGRPRMGEAAPRLWDPCSQTPWPLTGPQSLPLWGPVTHPSTCIQEGH